MNNEPKKITEVELNRKVAEMRGCKYVKLEATGPEGKPIWGWDNPGEYFYEDAPSPYTSNMNLAMTLFDEMPDACLEKDLTKTAKYAASHVRTDDRNTASRPCSLSNSPAMAICLSWLLLKTGEVYEVIENGE